MIAIQLSDEYRLAKRYDCMECGLEDGMLVIGNRGYCATPGCVHHEPIQFVCFPHWRKPKASRANREIFLNG
ncbi:hypothetical protein [Staphylospora marina]|uniref:hypothetical protein n=1 Tax=Staphylospora marina TaxID=2490858 RepID=UPI000F5BC4E2|nr:hypothetical protein [Staphylospora marina]